MGTVKSTKADDVTIEVPCNEILSLIDKPEVSCYPMSLAACDCGNADDDVA